MKPSDDDLLRAVRDANPIKDDAAGWVESEESSRVLDRLVSALDTEIPLVARPTWRRPLLIGSLCFAIIASVGAGYVASRRLTSDVFTVGCSADSRGDDLTIVPITQEMSPEDVCLREWRHQGVLPANNVVACVIDEGGTVVFPNLSNMTPQDLCGSVGASLPAAIGSYGGLTAEEVRRLTIELDGEIEPLQEGDTCYPIAALKKEIRALLTERNLKEWSVVDETSLGHPDRAGNGERCARYVIEPLEATIVLVNGDLQP